MTIDPTSVRCVHSWRIEPPSGPTSAAWCKRCGAEKSFRNGMDYPDFSLSGSRYGSYANKEMAS